jgi:drug/metabolite transporter (DMT)-like permease
VPVLHAGELAALTTAVCWATSSLAFTRAGRRIGSLSLNLLRLGLALVFAAIFATIRHGHPVPLGATAEQWLWLSLSGLVGFVLGDLCLFRAFVAIGPRLSLLLMATAPPMTALLGWLALGERLTAIDLVGMTLTLAGIAWVLTSQPAAARPVAQIGHEPPAMSRRTGVLLGLGGALGQAGGLVLSKHGMADYDAFAATQIRILAGIAGFAAIYTAIGWWPKFFAALRDRPSIKLAALGATLGPFLGVSFSLVAVQNTAAGVAASIMATTPILVIPLSTWLDREKIRWPDLAGAVLAIAGVALLFLD